LIAGRDDDSLPCETCGESARRIVTTVPGINGGSIPPMASRPIDLERFQNAHEDILADAKRAGVKPPDVLADARRQAALIKKHAPEYIGGT